MRSLSLLVLGLAVAAGHEECGTPDPTPEQIELEQHAAHVRHGSRRRLHELCVGCIPVDIVFHIFQDELGITNASLVWTDDHIQTELDSINEGFGGTPFDFQLRSITRTVDDSLAYLQTDNRNYGNDPVVFEVVRRFRIGGTSAVNVFINQGFCRTGGGSKGQASISTEFGLLPQDVGSPNDRIFVCDDIFAAVRDTLIHEIGHFLGLFHTFQGNSCAPGNPNDLVDDTPAQANHSNSRLCEEGRDSCLNRPGLDPIGNFMSYSPCRSQFTPGQIERMYHKFNDERKRIEPCKEVQLKFELFHDDSPSDTALSYRSYNELIGSWTPRVYLIPNSDIIDLAHQLTSRVLCWPKNQLHHIAYVDWKQDGFATSSGYFSMVMNDRELVRVTDRWPSSSRGPSLEFIIVGDSSLCPENSSRFKLDVSFSNNVRGVFPIKWQIRNANTAVLNQTISTQPGEELYTQVFRGRTLFVERCIPPGDYVFDIEELGNEDVFRSLDTFRLALDDAELYFGSWRNDTIIGAKRVDFTVSDPVDEVRDVDTMCFPGTALVDIENQGTIEMKDLQIGDSVKVSNGQYAPAYSFGHYQESASALFVTLNQELQISHAHMLSVEGRGFVPASTIEVGDKLVTGSGGSIEVASVSETKAQGLFAPFTPTGTIVVNNIVASSFISMQGDSAQLVIGDLNTGLTWHWLAHTFEVPHRLVCHYFGRCETETYTKTGLSTWVSNPHAFVLWMDRQHVAITGAAWVLVLPVVVVFSVVETLVHRPSAMILVVMALLRCRLRKHKAIW